MKKYSPYIFPLIVVVIVFFLVYRWYAVRTQRDTSQQPGYGEGIQIENLTPDQQKSVMKGSKDVSTTPLAPSGDDKQQPVAQGDIRYEIKDGKVSFSVAADLPESDKTYHVWIRSKDGDNLTDAFSLVMEKGGYMGSAALSENLLPLEVIVSQATNKADVMNDVVLKGIIEQKTDK